MKLRPRSREEKDEGVNLTPMLDVVFIMLIFFIVTASFVRESGLEVTRPDTSPRVEHESKVILVSISQSDQVWIDGRAVDLRSVRANIERMLAENPTAPVVIRADEESTNGTFVTVMDQARLAGASAVSMAAGI